ncbi:MAG: ABC transporter ATP-binding protein [Candidatus Hydrogenedentota bacterium]|jgi:ABC-2 type transport system ATP-binding protein|nr:ABC transporter ATP-binding protein [Candidatus Sumerlaea chitinivorans]RMH25186.1 MAG: ABC transporter ATP-binding protein [Candidatus Hydrogenedentota bacterium]
MNGRDSGPLIEIKNLTTGYGRKAVLHDVCLTFHGGAAGLVGPNGAGKTTLLRTILGFVTPYSGSVKVAGYELPRHSLEARAHLGYMPEVDAFIPKLSAVQLVAYMGELSGLPRGAAMERAHEMLDYTGVGEERYRPLETFSTGMRQRVKLAQAIIHDPQLLLLDEPTSGMDPTGRAQMLDLIRDLVENRGMNVILSTHLLNDVEDLAREIIILSDGRVASRQLRAPHRAAEEQLVYLVRIRGDMKRFGEELAGLGARLVEETAGSNGYVVLPSHAAVDLIFDAAHAAGAMVQRLELVRQKVEDIVLDAIKETTSARL